MVAADDEGDDGGNGGGGGPEEKNRPRCRSALSPLALGEGRRTMVRARANAKATARSVGQRHDMAVRGVMRGGALAVVQPTMGPGAQTRSSSRSLGVRRKNNNQLLRKTNKGCEGDLC